MCCADRPFSMRRLCLLLAVLTTLLSLPDPAAAQPLTIPRFDFSFSNPGARSLGFGGAFAGLADDATAAYANPAGLVQLTESEVSLDTRLWSRTPSFISDGRIVGDPNPAADLDDLIFGEERSDDFGPSFASVVIPKGRWSLALYGHQLAKFEQATEWNWFVVGGLPLPPIPSARESLDLDITSLGLSAGWRLDDRWSFGLGVLVSDVSFETSSEFYLPSFDGGDVGPFLPDRLLSRTEVLAEGTEVAFNVGALWQISERLSAGLVYRQGADTDGELVLGTGPGADLAPEDEVRIRSDSVFNVPDVVGLGLAYRSRDGLWTLAAEVDHVGYSGLVEIGPTTPVPIPERIYEDGLNFHFGVERALLKRAPILAFRLGGWLEANGDDLDRDEVEHVTAGLGIAAQRFQLDLAADLSEEIDTISLSFIYRL